MGISLMMTSRRSRSREDDYARGYEDAMMRVNNHWGDPEEEMEMRRRRRSAMHYPEEEMRRGRRSSMHYPWGDPEEDMEMRRGRRSAMHHPWGDPEEDMEMRRGRRVSMDDYMPRQIGFTAKSVPLDPSMESVLEHADHILQSPPETWKPYVQRKDFKGVVKMEVQELMKALEQGKSPKDIKKELTHTVAALMQLTAGE